MFPQRFNTQRAITLKNGTMFTDETSGQDLFVVDLQKSHRCGKNPAREMFLLADLGSKYEKRG